MTAYLLHTNDPYAVTLADVRAALGICTHEYDGLIAASITVTCIEIESRFKCSLRPQTWAVERKRGAPFRVFRKAVARFGTPSHIGKAHGFPGLPGLYHDCRYEPKPEDVEKAIRTCAKVCARHDDIDAAIYGEKSLAALWSRLSTASFTEPREIA